VKCLRSFLCLLFGVAECVLVGGRCIPFSRFACRGGGMPANWRRAFLIVVQAYVSWGLWGGRGGCLIWRRMFRRLFWAVDGVWLD